MNQNFPDTMKPKQIATNQLDAEAIKMAAVIQNQWGSIFAFTKIPVSFHWLACKESL